MKVQRYYWREIARETTRRFNAFATSKGYPSGREGRAKERETHERIRGEVLEEIKTLHERSPKYVYQEESDESVLTANGVKVVHLPAQYVSVTGVKHARIKAVDGVPVSVEEWVAAHFERDGWTVLQTESVPFHALFGTLMWLLIQDPKDLNVRMVGFGRRGPLPPGSSETQIWTGLPEDFGAPGYSTRRAKAIDAHFRFLPDDKEELLWIFDYWVEHSTSLREYLWAHRSEDVARARTLLQVLPVETTKRTLKYLVEDYWRRYCGWPDLFCYRGDDFLFAEVKSSKDRLTEDQKRWIRDNTASLRLPFQLVKVIRQLTRLHIPDGVGEEP